MAHKLLWYETQMKDNLLNIIASELKLNFSSNFKESEINGIEKDKLRKSQNAWIPSSHWVAGLIWHYVMLANRTNFNYNLTRMDHELMQYTHYGEGMYYNWHTDGDIDTAYTPTSGESNYTQESLAQDYVIQNADLVRKLSFVLQLSNPADYEGGELQIEDALGNIVSATKTKGALIFFDSRTRHRVSKVTKGFRQSLVGWVVGPMWK
jgi:PKHD-type hydroxylase|tara:strand:+ start:756 stop:1379 length:624 start_codon:yes stop_codon:yes gene_type:complete